MTNRPSGDQTSSSSALAHLRVVEVGDMPAAYAGRLLADLGADVIKVEPPGGDPSRWLPPFAGGTEGLERSLAFINANTNKRGIVLDLAGSDGDRATFAELLRSADVLVEATPFGQLEGWEFTDQRFQDELSGLVITSLTPFGRTGPHRSYKGSDAIANASGGFLFGQGDDMRGPCTAPAHQAYQLAGCVAALLAVAAVRHRRRTGAGQRLDISLQEALTFTNSSAVAGYTFEDNMHRRTGVRPSGGAGANIYRCKDGRYVHFTPGQPEMWRETVFNWMEETFLRGPEWQELDYRNAHSDEVAAVFADFIARFEADEFANEAQRRHLPAARLNTVGEFATCEQVRSRGWLLELEHPVIGRYTAPGFPIRMSGTPMQVRRPAPLLGQHQKEVLTELPAALQARATKGSFSDGVDEPMLAGLRMTDLTRQFAGPLGTEILGYYGMEVIKVESEAAPAQGRGRSLHADMNRVKLSCRLNLRQAEGKELFKRLVATSDVVVDNFSAGVLDRLGLGYEALRQVKPDIIQVVMPGWGMTGPLQSWVAWGWQLLAYNGLTALWGYPDSPMEARCKVAWPDRISALVMALGVVAAIEHKERTGQGQFIEGAMLEAQAAWMGPALLDYTVNGNEWTAAGYQEVLGAPYAPYGCYPCWGQDNWIIIACESDEEWRGLVRLIGPGTWAAAPRFATKSGRKAHREELDRLLSEWTRTLTPRLALRRLQEAGIAAGIPMSGEDLYYDVHLHERGHIVDIDHPGWGRIGHHGLPGIPSRSKASAAVPAPWIGAHDGYVLQELLGLSKEEVVRLAQAGAIR